MANEWEKVELYGANNDGEIRRYTIADGVAVSKGQLLALLDPRTASAAIATTTAFAGVASEEHKAGEGVTSVGSWTNGIFEAVASGAITLGIGITGVENNKVASGAIVTAIGLSDGAGILGYVLETATDGEKVNVRLRL